MQGKLLVSRDRASPFLLSLSSSQLITSTSWGSYFIKPVKFLSPPQRRACFQDVRSERERETRKLLNSRPARQRLGLYAQIRAM
jgi:hypothetical protein